MAQGTWRAIACMALVMSGARETIAQTQFEDLEPQRPVAVQDAQAIERYAFELEIAPAAIGPGGQATYGLATTLAWGPLPRTQVEISAPVASAPGTSGARKSGLAGLTVGALYALTTETLSMPAIAVAAQTV